MRPPGVEGHLPHMLTPRGPGFPDIRPPKVSDAIRLRDARVRAWRRDRPCLHMQLRARARWACAG